MKGSTKKLCAIAALGTLVTSSLCLATAGAATNGQQDGKWLSGDFHQHTLYTDGSTTFDFVMEKSNEYGLNWWANSEHGGGRNRDGNGVFWDERNDVTILGDIAYSGDPKHRIMWRWQSLRDFVFPQILDTRESYQEKKVFSGFEWNVPGHEHCSTAIVAKDMAEDASAISAFEYQFDKSDKDTSGDIIDDSMGPYLPLTKTNVTHADAVAACQWMQGQYEKGGIDNAWIIFAHIERNGIAATGGYDVNDFRDFNTAGPDVAFGFEGAPGHQVNNDRGFGNTVTCDDSGVCESEDFGGTYGGVGYYTARVGGLWDAMLSEGRRWFNFANSDYHKHYTAGGDDFYPGEYQKTWVYAVDQDGDGAYSYNEIADGMRSGNTYFAHGDLINHLEFEARDNNRKVSMGGELEADGEIKNLKIKITFKSPETNNCAADGTYITACAEPKVHHIDLIAGDITGSIDPEKEPEAYADPTNPTTRVIATFAANSWETDKNGNNVIVYHLKNVNKSMYFRLRGTNLAPDTQYETDNAGNPLPDALVTQNLGIDGAQEAWNDLWFYSNPIFVSIK